MALELQGENEGMRRSGPPDLHRFQGGKCSIKMCFCRASAAASQQSPHCLRGHCCCPQPSEQQPNRLSSWNRNAGSWPSHRTRNALCLPTLPLFKNKTKSPTPPSALQHPRHGKDGRWWEDTPHGPREAGLPEETQGAGQAGEAGLPQDAGKVLCKYIKIRYRAIRWGKNRTCQSLEEPQAPLENLYTRRMWTVWPRARSPGTVPADALHK